MHWQRIVIISLSLVMALLSGVLFFLIKTDAVHFILQTPFGYLPQKVYLEKGETLFFINLTSSAVWPAAGPHPTHTTYSEFDYQGELAPLGSWRFVFQREGTYTFHDHLHPSFTGIVVAGQRDVSAVMDESICTDIIDPYEAAACMEIYFRNVAAVLPFVDARAVFIDLSTRYQRSCHTFAHDLGKNAYRAYLNNELPDIGEEASSCGYGFWHGFTTAMQVEQGIDASKEFCATLRANSIQQQNINRMNCYHGVGIGLIPDPPPTHMWGNFNALVEPALGFCDGIGGDPLFRERCLTGIYHAMTIYMDLRQYGFSYDEDSLAICASQDTRYQRECFITVVAALPQATGFDLERTVQIIEEVVPHDLFFEVFEYAAVLFVQAEDSIEVTGAFIASCASLDSNLRGICINAAINKLYNNGVPGVEYQKVNEFCSSQWIQDTERKSCFDTLVSYAMAVYDVKKVESEVCSAVPLEYREVTPCAD